MSDYQLPDGREPLRFDVGRAAFYASKKTESGEVRYMFSMIKFLRNNRVLLTKEQISAINKRTADKLREKDPDFYKKIGSKGGKHGRKNS